MKIKRKATHRDRSSIVMHGILRNFVFIELDGGTTTLSRWLYLLLVFWAFGSI